jgi:hypothetical protein
MTSHDDTIAPGNSSVKRKKKETSRARTYARACFSLSPLGERGKQKEEQVELPRGRARGELQGDGKFVDGLWPWLTKSGLVPPYPDENVVPLLRVPAPPVLRQEHTEYARGELLVRAYRTVMELLTEQPCRILTRRGAVQSYKRLDQLLEVAALMVDKELPPLLWAHWRIGYWYSRPKPRIPPLTWVYQLKTMQKKRWMFRRDCNALLGVREQRMTALHRELAARWQGMRSALLRRLAGVPLDKLEATTRGVLAGYFPGNTYWELVEQARLSAHAEQEAIDRRLRRGEWLWSQP